MSCNGVFGYNYIGGDKYGEYLRHMAGFYNSELSHCPASLWPARSYTQALNMYDYARSQPYGFYFNFGTTPRYVVANPNEMPYNVAMSLHGYNNYDSSQALPSRYAAIAAQAGLNARLSVASGNLQTVKSLGDCKNSDCMKDNEELKQEIEAAEKKAEALLEQLQNVMKNEENLPMTEVRAKVDVICETSKELRKESDELYKRVQEAAKAAGDKAAEEAAAAAEQEAAAAGADDGGEESAITTTEGDKELKGNDKLAAEYGVKAPVVATDEVELSSIVRDVKNHTSNDDDDKDYKKIKEMFTTGAISKGNIVEVMDDLLNSKNHDLYDGIYEMDNSREIMNYFVDTLKLRIKNLSDAGYLTAAEKSEVLKMVSSLESGLGSGKDIKDSTTVEIGGKKMSGNDALKAIVAKLKGKGTQADFDAKVTAKKTERETKAKKDFYKAHAKTKTGKSVKDENAALPQGLTYLPNSKQFQWKNGDKVFKGDSYTKLNDEILKCGKPDIIANWNDVLKKLDENLK